MSQSSDAQTATIGKTTAPEVQVATETLPAETASAADGKVALDIEDAPFLKEEPKAEPKKTKEESAQEEIPEVPVNKKKKKLLLLIGAAVIGVGVIAAAFFFFFSGSGTPTPPAEVDPAKPEVIVVPSKPVVRVEPDVVHEFDLFVIPTGSTIGDTKFLICKFSTVSKSPAVNLEIDHKMLLLRDAVYFYLKGKTPEYLLDTTNAAQIKKDLVDILNGYLARGKLVDVLLDSYLGH
ncbi:MAG: flagellar basal body-associated FliL family protein [Desulfovibrio sp.]|nr:flagellar basal body-associated FliL family protein [Desulfovibrio sp.]